MANELTISTLGDAVRDRVKGAIFASIPDDAIEKLIAKEFESMTKSDYHSSKSPLQQQVFEEIKRQCSVRVAESVTKYLDQTFQSNPKELVDSAIKELAPLFMAGMTESFAAQAVQHLRNQLSAKGIYL